jgi:hypothetical protein
MAITSVPNEVAMKTVLIGTETTPGVAVVPDRRTLVPFTASPGVGTIRRSQDATGGYDRTAVIRRDFAEPGATFGGPATFQDLAIWSQYAIKGGVTGVSDAETTPGYLYTFTPTFNADDIATATVYHGVEGLPMIATGVRFDEFNISGDATSTDDNWQVGGTPFVKDADRLEVEDYEGEVTSATTTVITVTGAGWTIDQFQGAYYFDQYGSGIGEVRMIASNTADTITLETALSIAPTAGDPFYVSSVFPAIANPDYDPIPMEGTTVYLDLYNASASTLGTTDISDRVLSFNVSQTLGLARKRRSSGIIGRMGRGGREVSGTLRFEFDRWDEYKKFIEDQEISIRIEQTGPVIDATAGTTQLARIDVERAAFDSWTEDEDTNNMTVSLTFVALLETPVWEVAVKTDLATID